jgi:AraC family transcriptional activator of pobA
MNQLTETDLPKYSLKQVSKNNSSLFEIQELNDEYRQPPAIFLTPHRKDYYMMVLVRTGGSRHWVDMAPYTLKPDTFYFSVPHQVHVKEKSVFMNGILLCFTDEFLAIEENQLLKQLPVIQNPQNGHELNLAAENVAFIDDILRKMLAEYGQKQDWRNGMLLAYLRVLLIYLSRLYTEQFSEDVPEGKMLLKKFHALIDEQYKELHDVAGYADQLFISAGHLGEVIKQQSGKTAIEHIHERLILEAKEIAWQLGFEDASYFNRFFKRLNSETPLHYRRQSRDMYH